MNVAELNVVIGAELNDLDKGLKKATASVKEFGNDVNRSTSNLGNGATQAGKNFGSLGNIVKGVGVAMAAAFSVDAIMGIGKEIINVTANFQKMEAVLTNTLGSQGAAQNAMLMIQDIAAKTPFAVDQLTDSYVKLANRGIVPTSAEIIKLGDLAASTGKDFDQLTEAVLDAMTGEFERLKEFGVTAKAQGDKVAFTFKGVTTEVQKTDKAIKAYVLGLGEVNGVTGSMAAISQTLGGRISNLGDSFTRLFQTLGNGASGPLSFTVIKLTELVDGIRQLSASQDQLKSEKMAKAMQEYTAGVDQITSKGDFEAHLNLINKRYDAMAKAQDEVLSKIQKLESEAGFLEGMFSTSSSTKEIERLKGSFNALGLEMGAIQKSIVFTKEAYDKFLTGTNSGTTATVGIITRLKNELDDLQKSQLAATGAGSIEAINASIAAKEAEIKKYLELGDAQRKQAQTLRDINTELNLNRQIAAAIGPSYDLAGQQISALEGGIKNLISLGFKPGADAIQNFRKELDSLKAYEGRAGILETMPTGFDRLTASIAAAGAQMHQFKAATVSMQETTAPYIDAFTQASINSFGTMTSALQTLAIEGFSYLGQTIGEALTGNFQGAEAFFGGMMSIISTFLKSLGEATIAVGVAGLGIKAAFANPFAAIAAGVALVALSGVAGSIMKKGPTGGGATGSGSSYRSPAANTSFQGANANAGGAVEFKIKGQELVGVLRTTGYNAKRTG